MATATATAAAVQQQRSLGASGGRLARAQPAAPLLPPQRRCARRQRQRQGLAVRALGGADPQELLTLASGAAASFAGGLPGSLAAAGVPEPLAAAAVTLATGALCWILGRCLRRWAMAALLRALQQALPVAAPAPARSSTHQPTVPCPPTTPQT